MTNKNKNHSSPPGSAGLQPGNTSSLPWHSRGYMPHFDSHHAIQHVTFRLADSISASVLERFKQELKSLPPRQQESERRQRIESWLDAGHGSCILQNQEAACLMRDTLLQFDGERYILYSWVIMPNHVHVLFQQREDWTMSRIVASWKSYTGKRLMPMLRDIKGHEKANRVWYREYWDRFIRDERHFRATILYIQNNPVKAGLVKNPQDWQWSSAAFQ